MHEIGADERDADRPQVFSENLTGQTLTLCHACHQEHRVTVETLPPLFFKVDRTVPKNLKPIRSDTRFGFNICAETEEQITV